MLHRTVMDTWGEIKRRMFRQARTVTRPADPAWLSTLVTVIQARLATCGDDIDPRQFMAQIAADIAARTADVDYDREYAALLAYLRSLSERDQRIYTIWQETRSTIAIAQRLQMDQDDARAIITEIYAGLRNSLLDIELTPQELPLAPATESH